MAANSGFLLDTTIESMSFGCTVMLWAAVIVVAVSVFKSCRYTIFCSVLQEIVAARQTRQRIKYAGNRIVVVILLKLRE